MPWLLQLIAKLLKGDPGAAGLLAKNPFPNTPPRYIRVDLYKYEFTAAGDETNDWWKRQFIRNYIRPLSVDDPALNNAIRRILQ